MRIGRVAPQVQLDALVGGRPGEQVHHAHVVTDRRPRRAGARSRDRPSMRFGNRCPATIVCARLAPVRRPSAPPGGSHRHRTPDRIHPRTREVGAGDRGRHGVLVMIAVACASNGPSGPSVRPSTAQVSKAPAHGVDLGPRAGPRRARQGGFGSPHGRASTTGIGGVGTATSTVIACPAGRRPDRNGEANGPVAGIGTFDCIIDRFRVDVGRSDDGRLHAVACVHSPRRPTRRSTRWSPP